MQYTLVQTSAPAAEPVTVAEARTWAWVIGEHDDALLGSLIPAVRRRLEELTGLQLVTATWQLLLDCFPAEIQIRKAPVSAVTEIEYRDTEGVLQVLDPDLYQVDAAGRPARIRPAWGKVWPAVRHEMNAVTVTFTAGYGAAAAVPAEIKQRLWQGVIFRYQHRHETNEDWLDAFLARNWT